MLFRDLKRCRPKCPQSPENNNSDNWQSYVEFPDVAESETDCLNLFVIRPSIAALTRIGWDPVKKLPVMIWIHGGGYSFGAGTDPMWGKTHQTYPKFLISFPSN